MVLSLLDVECNIHENVSINFYMVCYFLLQPQPGAHLISMRMPMSIV